MNKYIFYHIFLFDKIDTIVEDQLKTLINSQLLNESELYITIMDAYSGQYKLNDNNMDLLKSYSKDIYFVNGNFYEHATLKKLHEKAKIDNGYYLYFHTKGCTRVNIPDFVFKNGEVDGICSYRNFENWRKIMDHFNIEQWKTCVKYLDKGFDMVGCNYLKTHQHFSGNFWWASSNFIKKLPPLVGDRLSAEPWMSKIKHRVICLYPPISYEPKYHFRGIFYTPPEEYIDNIIVTEHVKN